MPPETIPFAFLFVMGVLAGVQIEKANTKERRAKWLRKNAWRKKRERSSSAHGLSAPRHDALPERPVDAADQLRAVMKADFKAQRLLNKSETRLFKALDKIVIEARPGWQVMAQVTLAASAPDALASSPPPSA